MGVTVGIDIGTTSVKAVAADDDGEVLARCRIPHDLVAPTPDRFEHDPAQAWSAGVLEAWRQVRAGLEQPVAAMTVAAMVPSMCGVDAAGRPVTPGLLYGDARGRAEPEVGEAAAMAGWVASRSGVAGVWPAQAVANHALTGVAAVDTITGMAMLPLFDGVRWDAALCERLGFDPALLPAISPGTASIGEVDGALVNGGTVDVFAEQLCAGASEVGDVLLLCGTTLIAWTLTTGWPEVDGLWTVPYTLPGLTAIGGASNAGGLFVDNVRRLLGPVDDAQLDSVDPGSVPVWLPYLRGERVPFHDPDRRAELVGLGLGHGPAEVLRAAYESTAFVVRNMVDRSGVEPRRIVAIGGGTRSTAWMQALADGTGLPVEVSARPETAALGAAYLARVTAGLEPDTSRATSWSRISGTVEPRPAWASACTDRYATFLARTGR